jgi:UDP-N-acetylglucosamine--N-acetylmuramyl-(pentapeptide) pyrophosphoryl-undecaprenol N-acetylglucosamine transferase
LSKPSTRLLVAASGTGGHVFPAIATAEVLQAEGYTIEWLGVPDRMETSLVPQHFPLHTVKLSGLQGRPGARTARLGVQLAQATWATRQLLRQGDFAGVLTTGGYIAAPAILAARSLGLPAILHESNALPGKVTRWLSPWCSLVALGFDAAESYLPKARTVVVGTPVRSDFLAQFDTPLKAWEIPAEVPVILVVGGSQGAVAVNQLIRQAAPAWLKTGAWIIHQTGLNDPDIETFSHPHYIHQPFFDPMAPLLQRATLAIGRAGAGTLTELAVTATPSVLIPYPFAAENHQIYNARAFVDAGAALLAEQSTLTALDLQHRVLELLEDESRLRHMSQAAASLASNTSAQRLAELIQKQLSLTS